MGRMGNRGLALSLFVMIIEPCLHTCAREEVISVLYLLYYYGVVHTCTGLHGQSTRCVWTQYDVLVNENESKNSLVDGDDTKPTPCIMSSISCFALWLIAFQCAPSS
jgi:hypothetical protein